jgi:hypothetical protein
MPQLLPQFPNLEHLKGQAKDVLRVGRRRHPAWKLAHAQHAVARGYGFTSWPDLKTHTESLRPHSPASPIRRRGTDGERESGKEHPLAGTWVFNPSRSKMQASSQILHDGVMLEFSIGAGAITMTQAVVDPSGHDIAVKLTIRTDGSGQPVRFGQGLVLEARMAESQRIEAVIRNGDRIVSQGTYEVSPDRQTLAFNTADTQMVFDRVGAR